MELEFDKEIDAILRKARAGGIVAVTAATSRHLDADAISAFAENVLPDKSKRLYTEHFGDCDRCRQMLSQTILLNSEADATAASSDVRVPAIAPFVPWYAKIFGSPNLAFVMGALVLAFSGILGLLVIEKRNETANSTVSQATEPRPGGPYLNPDSPATNTSTTNSIATANTSASNSTAVSSNSTANTATNMTARPEAPGGSPNVGLDKDKSATGESPEPAKPAVVAAPAPPADQPKTEVAEKAADEEKPKEDSKVTALATRNAVSDDRKSRETVSKSQKRNDGPSRASGQVQQQDNNLFNTNVFDNTATKQVGSKTFNLRNGVWYDRAYHGQATKNVGRGTDEYKKLDDGIRHIAESLSGIVVVVSREKAYRIQ